MNGWSSHAGDDRWGDEPAWVYEITWEWEPLPGQRYPGDPGRRKAVHTPVYEAARGDGRSPIGPGPSWSGSDDQPPVRYAHKPVPRDDPSAYDPRGSQGRENTNRDSGGYGTRSASVPPQREEPSWNRPVAIPDHLADERARRRPDQARPDQARPDQARPDQARPDQARPDQARSDQARPDQAAPPGRRPPEGLPPAPDQRRGSAPFYGRPPADAYPDAGREPRSPAPDDAAHRDGARQRDDQFRERRPRDSGQFRDGPPRDSGQFRQATGREGGQFREGAGRDNSQYRDVSPRDGGQLHDAPGRDNSQYRDGPGRDGSPGRDGGQYRDGRPAAGPFPPQFRPGGQVPVTPGNPPSSTPGSPGGAYPPAARNPGARAASSPVSGPAGGSAAAPASGPAGGPGSGRRTPPPRAADLPASPASGPGPAGRRTPPPRPTDLSAAPASGPGPAGRRTPPPRPADLPAAPASGPGPTGRQTPPTRPADLSAAPASGPGSTGRRTPPPRPADLPASPATPGAYGTPRAAGAGESGYYGRRHAPEDGTEQPYRAAARGRPTGEGPHESEARPGPEARPIPEARQAPDARMGGGPRPVSPSAGVYGSARPAPADAFPAYRDARPAPGRSDGRSPDAPFDLRPAPPDLGAPAPARPAPQPTRVTPTRPANPPAPVYPSVPGQAGPFSPQPRPLAPANPTSSVPASANPVPGPARPVSAPAGPVPPPARPVSAPAGSGPDSGSPAAAPTGSTTVPIQPNAYGSRPTPPGPPTDHPGYDPRLASSPAVPPTGYDARPVSSPARPGVQPPGYDPRLPSAPGGPGFQPAGHDPRLVSSFGGPPTPPPANDPRPDSSHAGPASEPAGHDPQGATGRAWPGSVPPAQPAAGPDWPAPRSPGQPTSGMPFGPAGAGMPYEPLDQYASHPHAAEPPRPDQYQPVQYPPGPHQPDYRSDQIDEFRRGRIVPGEFRAEPAGASGYPDAAGFSADGPEAIEPVTAPPFATSGYEGFDDSVTPVTAPPASGGYSYPDGPVAGSGVEPVTSPPVIGSDPQPADDSGMSWAESAWARSAAPEDAGLDEPRPTSAPEPVEEEPHGLGWLLSMSGLGATTPAPEQAEEPLPEPTVDHVPEPVEKPLPAPTVVPEPATDQAATPVQEPPSEPAADSMPKPVAEPHAKSTMDPEPEPAMGPELEADPEAAVIALEDDVAGAAPIKKDWFAPVPGSQPIIAVASGGTAATDESETIEPELVDAEIIEPEIIEPEIIEPEIVDLDDLDLEIVDAEIIEPEPEPEPEPAVAVLPQAEPDADPFAMEAELHPAAPAINAGLNDAEAAQDQTAAGRGHDDPAPDTEAERDHASAETEPNGTARATIDEVSRAADAPGSTVTIESADDEPERPEAVNKPEPTEPEPAKPEPTEAREATGEPEAASDDTTTDHTEPAVDDAGPTTQETEYVVEPEAGAGTDDNAPDGSTRGDADAGAAGKGEDAEKAAATAAEPAAPAAAAVRAPIRQRRDQMSDSDRRRQDPEQVLAAYPWVFDPQTLREQIDDGDQMWVVVDRLTDKLEYAERDAVRARLLSLRAVALRLLGDLDAALADGRAALGHALATGELRAIAVARTRLAHVLQWRGEYAEADKLYAEAASPELPVRLFAEIHELAGRSAFEQERNLEAMNHFESALDLRKGADPEMVERIELALDVIVNRSAEGWGPYPRTHEEILGEPSAPRPLRDERSGLWGYVGAIPPRFAQAQPFAEGVAWVRRPEAPAWELIDSAGRLLIDASSGYLAAGRFSEGLAWVSGSQQGGWIAIDRQNRVIVPGGLEDAKPFHNGLALVKHGGWGVLDRHGRAVVQPRYRGFATALVSGGLIEGFTDEGLAVVDAGDRFGVVDRTGQLIVAPVHAAVRIHPSAFLIADKYGLWGALNRQGEPLVELKYKHRADAVDEIERSSPESRPVL